MKLPAYELFFKEVSIKLNEDKFGKIDIQAKS